MRSLKACGLEFRSDRLWEEYIEWEIQNNEVDKASTLFDILLMTPTINYQKNFEKYCFIIYRRPILNYFKGTRSL